MRLDGQILQKFDELGHGEFHGCDHKRDGGQSTEDFSFHAQSMQENLLVSMPLLPLQLPLPNFLIGSLMTKAGSVSCLCNHSFTSSGLKRHCRRPSLKAGSPSWPPV